MGRAVVNKPECCRFDSHFFLATCRRVLGQDADRSMGPIILFKLNGRL